MINESSSATELAEETANILADKFCAALQANVEASWCEMASIIARDSEKYSAIFNEEVVALAKLYDDSQSLFVNLEQCVYVNEADAESETSEEETTHQ